MKYNDFEIEIYDKDNDANYENTLLNTTMYHLSKFQINYESCKIPSIELVISTTNPVIYQDIKNLHIVISKNKAVTEYDCCILDLLFRKGLLHLSGYLCDYNDMVFMESSYLGDSIVKCLNNLKIKKEIKINGKDSNAEDFKEDFPFKYWKIQESNCQSLIKIMSMAYSKAIFSMDNDSLYVLTSDFASGDSDATYGFLPPTERLYISSNGLIDDYLSDDETVNKAFYTDEIGSSDKLSGFSRNTSLGKFIIGEENNTNVKNYLESLPIIQYKGQYLVKFLYKRSIPNVMIGETMAADDTEFKSVSKFTIIEKIEQYTPDEGLTVVLLLSGKYKRYQNAGTN